MRKNNVLRSDEKRVSDTRESISQQFFKKKTETEDDSGRKRHKQPTQGSSEEGELPLRIK